MGDTYGSASVTIESYSKPNLITAILNVTNRQIDMHLHSLVYWAEKCFLVSVWNVQYYKAVCSLGATWAIHAYLIKLQKCLVTATEYCHFVWVLFFALLMGWGCVCVYRGNECKLCLATGRILLLLWSQGGCCQQCPWRQLEVLAQKLFGFVYQGHVCSRF